MDQALGKQNKGNDVHLNGSSSASVVAFLNDAITEESVRDVLVDLVSGEVDVRRGNIQIAIAAMSKLPTPQVLVVDISGEVAPVKALEQLSEVVEPGVRILAIGDADEVDFYREVIRSSGVHEYLFKPVTRESIARYFVPYIHKKTAVDEVARGGRVIAVTGASGGVGASTIAANLAWYLGVMAKRHTVLVDGDLEAGVQALLLGGKAGSIFVDKAEKPDKTGIPFNGRAAQALAERLHLLGSDEQVDNLHHTEARAIEKWVEALRIRYNFIIIDLQNSVLPFNRELAKFIHHRVVVIDPTLAGIRDGGRLLALRKASGQPQSPTVVLNRTRRGAGLSRQQIQDALKTKINICIPDLSRQLYESTLHRQVPVASCGAFREAIGVLAREIGFVGSKGEGTIGLKTRRLEWTRRLVSRDG